VNVALLLEVPASITPGAPALVDDGEWSFGELARRIKAVAGRLLALGLARGDRVAVLSTNSRRYVEVLFGAAAAGLAAVPVNCRAKPAELRFVLEDCAAPLVLAEDRYAGLVGDLGPRSPRVEVLDAGFDEAVDAAEPVAEAVDVDEDELALLLYTSGTTSLPKGAMLTHGALSGYVLGRVECADGSPRGRSLLAAPLHHVAAVASVASALYSGSAVVVLPQFDASAWLDAVERHEVTQAFVVPTMLARILAEQERSPRDLSSLELVTYGAAPMPRSVIERALALFPSGVGFSGAYGQTETTSTVTVLGPDDHRLEGSPEEIERKRRRLASVGRPVEDVELRVVGADGEALGPYEVGEVQVRTARAMRGYWHADKRQVPEAVGADGWVRTGDLGFLDEDGYLFLEGRASDVIIRGGENVAPEEVESVLAEYEGVAEVGAVGLPDEEWGEVVGAVLVPRPGFRLDLADLRRFCSERLPAHKRPERLALADELPRTSTGKLLRRELVALLSPASGAEPSAARRAAHGGPGRSTPATTEVGSLG
jgi:acyl-CoA synthetase (AMP-forming)/AMP-acid ligase II